MQIVNSRFIVSRTWFHTHAGVLALQALALGASQAQVLRAEEATERLPEYGPV